MKTKGIVFGCLLGTAALALAYQGGKKLYINGQVASTSIKTINGKTYVPIADVAKALDLTVQPRGDGFELVKSGGAGQIGNDNVGKIGSEVFTGQWRFKVNSVEKTKHYKVKLSHFTYEREFDAKDGFEFIVVNCRVKNGRKTKDELVFANWDGNNTAITDASEQSYQPKLYDVNETESAPNGTTFLPGAAINFNLVFEVPEGTEAKDLIFTAIRYEFRAGFDQKKVKPQDIRVSLSK